MPTFINLMPGERRSCIGCHEKRKKAPSVTCSRFALDHSVQAIAPQPSDTGPRPVHYLTDIQPILDKHCVSCHSGEKAKGRLVLTNEPSGDVWNRSYTDIVGKGLVSFRDSKYGRSGTQHLPPLSYGSHLSKLTARIRKDPCKGNLTREEFIRIVTWIDANSPYYGDYTDLKE